MQKCRESQESWYDLLQLSRWHLNKTVKFPLTSPLDTCISHWQSHAQLPVCHRSANAGRSEEHGTPDLQLQPMLLTLSLNLVQTKVGSVEPLYWSCRHEAYRTLIATCETPWCHSPDNHYASLYSNGKVRHPTCGWFPIPISKPIFIGRNLIVNYVLS